MTLQVVQYSGGIGSWAATQRVIAEHGTADLVLLVADTRVEDPDLWRFVHDSTVAIGVAPTVVADGRTPFEVFRDQRFLVLSPRRHLSKPGRAPQPVYREHGGQHVDQHRLRSSWRWMGAQIGTRLCQRPTGGGALIAV